MAVEGATDIRDLAGGAIMPDGKVGLILDINGRMKLNSEQVGVH